MTRFRESKLKKKVVAFLIARFDGTFDLRRASIEFLMEGWTRMWDLDKGGNIGSEKENGISQPSSLGTDLK